MVAEYAKPLIRYRPDGTLHSFAKSYRIVQWPGSVSRETTRDL